MSVTKRSICEGDLVRAEKNGTTIEGKIWNDCSGVLMLGSSRRHIEDLFADEWTVTVIEKAKPKLPTEPGFYVEAGKPASLENIWKLSEGGRWLSAASGRYDDRAAQFAPFTKLEPASETAKKVLERFQEVHAGAFVTVEEVAAQLAAEFGVTA